jgi:hypothetical protein
MLKKLFILFVLVLPAKLFAQNTLTGNIFDNDLRSLAIEGATIKNLTSKAVALSNKDGHFIMPAKIGDLISFSFSTYETDTVYLINLFPKNVYLRAQVNTLNTVNVTTTKLSPYLDIKNPDAKPAKEVEYDKNRGGIRLSLGYGKFRKDQEKIQGLMENEKFQAEITENFNEETVKKAVKFEGKDIRAFLDLFRPTVEQVKAERPFNYEFYIVKAHHSWTKLPLDQRKLPPLTKTKIENN